MGLPRNIPPSGSLTVMTVVLGCKPPPSVMILTGIGPSRAIMDSANCPLHSKLGRPACLAPADNNHFLYFLSKAYGSMTSGWIHTAKTGAPGPKLSTTDEEMEIRKMREFVISFTNEWLKVGYTQADIAQQSKLR